MIVAVAGISIIGCGGAGTSAEGQSTGEYIAKADAICTAEQSKRQELERRVDDLAPITAEETGEVASLLRRASEDRRSEIRRLRALRATAAEMSTSASLLSFLTEESADLEAWAGAYSERNATRIRVLQARIAEDSAKTSAIARHYGFHVCGNPGNPSQLPET